MLIACGTIVSAWALTDGAVAAAALLGSAVALVVVRALWECGTSSAVLTEAVHDSEAQRAGVTVPIAHADGTLPVTHLQATG
jgi:hypothetical protein